MGGFMKGNQFKTETRFHKYLKKYNKIGPGY